MKVLNGEIYAAREPVAKLIQEKFPVLVSYKLAKLAKGINEHWRLIEEVRQALVSKYGSAPLDKPRNLSVKEDSEGFPQFLEEYKTLMQEEVDLSVEVVKLPEKVAGTCDQCHHNLDRALEIEPSILLALDKFISVDGVR